MANRAFRHDHGVHKSTRDLRVVNRAPVDANRRAQRIEHQRTVIGVAMVAIKIAVDEPERAFIGFVPLRAQREVFSPPPSSAVIPSEARNLLLCGRSLRSSVRRFLAALEMTAWWQVPRCAGSSRRRFLASQVPRFARNDIRCARNISFCDVPLFAGC